MAGKDNLMADCLSRAQVGSMHLGRTFVAMAEDQLTEFVIQVFRSAATGFRLENVRFQDSGVTLLCVGPFSLPKAHICNNRCVDCLMLTGVSVRKVFSPPYLVLLFLQRI